MTQQVQPKTSGGERRDLTKTQARLEKQVSRAEGEIAELEAKVKAREMELADPKLYEEFGKWNGLQEEQDGWKRDLERLTARWESLSAELEEVKQKLGALR
jgi:ATP-binding cassette subfamily F protein 3